jgi:hypothetical protein
MLAEQGGPSGFLSDWGGPVVYSQVARMSSPDRITYYAIKSGLSDPSQIAVATGLSEKVVGSSVLSLRGKGLVEVEEASTLSGA